MGIATGIVQEFQFGTNWSVYSRYVGNIFGSLLAAEGIFAFMLEGGFLGLMLFGGQRLGNKLWLFATTMVVAGATISATWIVMANSWMQTPRGYELRDAGHGEQAFMTSFREVVFTPSFGPRFCAHADRLVDHRALRSCCRSRRSTCSASATWSWPRP